MVINGTLCVLNVPSNFGGLEKRCAGFCTKRRFSILDAFGDAEVADFYPPFARLWRFVYDEDVL